MLQILDADSACIPIIIDLALKTWPQTYIPIVGAEQVNYMLGRFYSPQALAEQMQEHNHRFVIGYHDDSPVAFGSFSEIEKGIFKLHKLYVSPDRQGEGIGKQMVDNILAATTKLGGKTLLLNVNRYNQSAITFYKNSGFNSIHEEDIDIGNGYFMNDYVMVRHLTNE